jgi:hypothetical protein
MIGYSRFIAHHTIFAVDVEGFGDHSRTLPHQLTVRNAMYEILRQAFAVTRIPWPACYREDRGDGMFLLAPAQMPKALFVESLPYALVAGLRQHNSEHPPESRIRLRMAVHAGEVAYDQYGVTANAINLAFRLLSAPALKTALADSNGVLALITSDWFYDEVVRHSLIADHAEYRQIQVDVKETSTVGWIARPDHPFPPERALLPAARRWRFK